LATGPSRSGRAELTQAAARLRLFLSSYAALFVILAVRFDQRGLRLVCAGLALLGVGDTWIITHRVRTKALPYTITIRTVADVGGEVSGYVASYLLPFVTVANPSGRDLLGYGLFLAVAALIYVRSDLVRVNPTLYLFGYRVLHVQYGERGDQYLISRRVPWAGDVIEVVDVAGVLLGRGQVHAEP
jgi:hypothetical protein